MPKNLNLEGISLQPQLQSPMAARDRPAITSSYFGNHSIRNRDWRLVVYDDGASFSQRTPSSRREAKEGMSAATIVTSATQLLVIQYFELLSR